MPNVSSTAFRKLYPKKVMEIYLWCRFVISIRPDSVEASLLLLLLYVYALAGPGIVAVLTGVNSGGSHTLILNTLTLCFIQP